MSRSPGIRRRLLLALAGSALLIIAASAPAQATTGYGDLAHFGAGAGTGQGQFKPSTETDAFGVDPTTNDMYVGDEPTVGEYRIQKLGADGKFLAEVKFSPSRAHAIEGLAIDPTLKRVYALAVALRSENAVIDPEVPAAGTIYAFSTEGEKEGTPEGKLPPAEETKEGGKLATLKATSEELGPTKSALLEPSGIAVDPVTHDVIVMGKEDQGEQAEEEKQLVVFERVESDGKIGKRYVDTTDFFESEEEKTGEFVEPSSPTVTAGGRLYVESYDTIVEVPSNFSSAEPPKALIHLEALLEELVAFPGEPRPIKGGGLSFVATKGTTEGTLYTYAGIAQSMAGKLTSKYPGALAFKYAESGGVPTATEIGWTGGQSPASGAGKCTVSFSGPAPPMIAGGSGETVFMFDSKVPQVVEFGPGGSGCLTASATAPQAAVAGKVVSEVPAGTKVTLSSAVMQANALSVEWEFGDGTTEKVTTDEYQQTSIEHVFVKGGNLKFKEIIHTDDLATPTLEEEGTIDVKSSPPTAEFEAEPMSITAGETVSFNGSLSHANGSQITEYHWHFGDGTAEVITMTPKVTHAYQQAGEYTAELSVIDSLSEESKAPAVEHIKVSALKGPTKTTTTTTATPPPTTPTATTPTTTTTSVKPVTPPPLPVVEVMGGSLAVGPTGALALKVSCAAGETSCAGTVTLRTLGAVSASAGRSAKKKGKAAILTLATGAFTVAGGQVKVLTLHLSAKARALLAHSHVLHVRATIVAHDPAGATHTTQATLTLRASKAKHSGHH